VAISYGHLTNASITNGQDANDPARESALYLSHADALTAARHLSEVLSAGEHLNPQYSTRPMVT